MLPDTPDSGLAALPDTADGMAALYAWPERTEEPFLRANMIASLDGGSTVDGRSAGLGNAADEELFAVLRDLAEVILVGAGTVRAERYGGVRLTADRQARRERWGAAPAPPPIAVVTARGLDPGHPLFTDTVTPPIVITTRRAATTVPTGATVIVAGSDDLDLAVAVAELGAAGYGRIHCEGGPALLGALTSADLLDECCLTIAPMLLGSGAAPMLPVRLDEPARWSLRTARVQGNHLFTRYRRVRGV